MLVISAITFLARSKYPVTPKPLVKAPISKHVHATAKPTPPNSWSTFVASLKKSCAQKDDTITVDYDAMHEYAGRSYGVVVIAWKDSEYEVDLYRSDPKTSGWEASPIHEGDGMGIVDVRATAKKWKLPEESISEWLTAANQFMHEKYQKQAK